MKTVTKYLCETTNTEFATEKEALDSERFELRVVLEVEKRRRQPLTKGQLRQQMGDTHSQAFLKALWGTLRVRQIEYRRGRLYLDAELHTVPGLPPNNFALYQSLCDITAASDSIPVYLMYGGEQHPVVGVKATKAQTVLYIETAYEEPA